MLERFTVICHSTVLPSSRRALQVPAAGPAHVLLAWAFGLLTWPCDGSLGGLRGRSARTWYGTTNPTYCVTLFGCCMPVAQEQARLVNLLGTCPVPRRGRWGNPSANGQYSWRVHPRHGQDRRFHLGVSPCAASRWPSPSGRCGIAIDWVTSRFSA